MLQYQASITCACAWSSCNCGAEQENISLAEVAVSQGLGNACSMG